jgi:hypothetical protein
MPCPRSTTIVQSRSPKNRRCTPPFVSRFLCSCLAGLLFLSLSSPAHPLGITNFECRVSNTPLVLDIDGREYPVTQYNRVFLTKHDGGSGKCVRTFASFAAEARLSGCMIPAGFEGSLPDGYSGVVRRGTKKLERRQLSFFEWTYLHDKAEISETVILLTCEMSIGLY